MLFRTLIWSSLIASLSASAVDKSFSFTPEKSTIRFYHDPKEQAKKIKFTFIPPAKKLFANFENQLYLFPPLYSEKKYFTKIFKTPYFLNNISKEKFVVYKIKNRYFTLDASYTLFSATIRNGLLLVSAKNKKNEFVALNSNHFNIYNEKGKQLSVNITDSSNKNISLLIDRSGSMSKFNSEVSNAIKQFSSLPIIKYYCGIYEFGSTMITVQKPFKAFCNNVLSDYNLSSASGETPLYESMERAYLDLKKSNGVSSVIIISDGIPTDTPSNNLLNLSKKTPTFILWTGNHNTNYISKYTIAHAISKNGSREELSDFFKSISFSVHSHQVFNIKNQ